MPKELVSSETDKFVRFCSIALRHRHTLFIGSAIHRGIVFQALSSYQILNIGSHSTHIVPRRSEQLQRVAMVAKGERSCLARDLLQGFEEETRATVP